MIRQGRVSSGGAGDVERAGSDAAALSGGVSSTGTCAAILGGVRGDGISGVRGAGITLNGMFAVRAIGTACAQLWKPGGGGLTASSGGGGGGGGRGTCRKRSGSSKPGGTIEKFDTGSSTIKGTRIGTRATFAATLGLAGALIGLASTEDVAACSRRSPSLVCH